jgi:hypothetical protein
MIRLVRKIVCCVAHHFFLKIIQADPDDAESIAPGGCITNKFPLPALRFGDWFRPSPDQAISFWQVSHHVTLLF